MHPGIGKERTDGKHSPDEHNGDAEEILPGKPCKFALILSTLDPSIEKK
jgi:hypothetical protein